MVSGLPGGEVGGAIMAGRGSSMYNYEELWMDLMCKNKEPNSSWEDVGFNCTAQNPGIVLESSNAGDRSLSLKLFFSWHLCILVLWLPWRFLLSPFCLFPLFNAASLTPWILVFLRVPVGPCFPSGSPHTDCFTPTASTPFKQLASRSSSLVQTSLESSTWTDTQPFKMSQS